MKLLKFEIKLLNGYEFINTIELPKLIFLKSALKLASASDYHEIFS